MRLTLKSSISLLLCQAVYSYGEPCWQAQTEEAPDGRICVFFDSVTTPGRTTVYNGRSAPDLATIDQTKVGHFCAYEVDRGVERAEEYYWLKGSETDIRTKLKSYKEYANKPESADQSKKWVFDSKAFTKIFDFCEVGGEPSTLPYDEDIYASETKLCVKSTNADTLDFGKISGSGKCKTFDATIRSGQPALTFTEWKKEKEKLPDITYVGVGWAVRLNSRLQPTPLMVLHSLLTIVRWKHLSEGINTVPLIVRDATRQVT